MSNTFPQKAKILCRWGVQKTELYYENLYMPFATYYLIWDEGGEEKKLQLAQWKGKQRNYRKGIPFTLFGSDSPVAGQIQILELFGCKLEREEEEI